MEKWEFLALDFLAVSLAERIALALVAVVKKTRPAASAALISASGISVFQYRASASDILLEQIRFVREQAWAAASKNTPPVLDWV